jgi:syntaxin-binding protein 1
MIMSTTQNVDRIIADFSDGRKQYSAAHVFFIDGEQIYYVSDQTVKKGVGLSEALVERLVSSPAEPHLKALKELYLNFWSMSLDLFTVFGN